MSVDQIRRGKYRGREGLARRRFMTTAVTLFRVMSDGRWRSVRDVCALTGLSSRYARRYLYAMCDNGVAERTGGVGMGVRVRMKPRWWVN
jgi:hypothetical protein